MMCSLSHLQNVYYLSICLNFSELTMEMKLLLLHFLLIGTCLSIPTPSKHWSTWWFPGGSNTRIQHLKSPMNKELQQINGDIFPRWRGLYYNFNKPYNTVE